MPGAFSTTAGRLQWGPAACPGQRVRLRLWSEFCSTGHGRSSRTADVIRLGPEGTSQMQAKSFGPDPGDRPDARGPIISGKPTTRQTWRRVRAEAAQQPAEGLQRSGHHPTWCGNYKAQGEIVLSQSSKLGGFQPGLGRNVPGPDILRDDFVPWGSCIVSRVIINIFPLHPNMMAQVNDAEPLRGARGYTSAHIAEDESLATS